MISININSNAVITASIVSGGSAATFITADSIAFSVDTTTRFTCDTTNTTI